MKCALDGCDNEFERTRKSGVPQRYCCRLHRNRDADRRAYALNPAKVLADNNKWRKENKEEFEIRDRKRRSTPANKEKARQRAFNWYGAHKTKAKARNRAYALSRPAETTQYKRKSKFNIKFKELAIKLGSKMEKSNERNC